MEAPSSRIAQPSLPDRGAIEARAASLAACHPSLAAHGLRVSELASRIVERICSADDELRSVTLATAHLHDLGKLALSAAVLEQPSSLSLRQRDHVERHSAIGANLVLALGFEQQVAQAVRSHHEWWNGGGYPDRMSGSAIPLASRIIAVADAFDAMTSNRPYREAMPLEAALGELDRCAGSQFDSVVVATLIGLYESPHSSKGTYDFIR